MQPQGGELLAELVVHLPGDPTPFVFLGEDQARQQLTPCDLGAFPLDDLELQRGVRAGQLGCALAHTLLELIVRVTQ